MEMKIEMTENQIILFTKFLDKIKSDGPPRNYVEWGEEYELLINLESKHKSRLNSQVLSLKFSEEYFAIFNFFASWIREIKNEKQGIDLFFECQELFFVIHKMDRDYFGRESVSPFVYIPKNYVDKEPLEKIYVVPGQSVEEVLSGNNNHSNELNTHITSTELFNKNCELYIDEKLDEWVFEYNGVVQKRDKSKFQCLLAKKALQKELGL